MLLNQIIFENIIDHFKLFDFCDNKDKNKGGKRAY